MIQLTGGHMSTKTAFVLLSLILVLSACSSGAVPPPTATHTSVPFTVTPSETPIPPTPTPEFEQYYTEEFENDLKYWPSFVVDGSGYGGAVLAKEPSEKVVLKAEDGFFKFDISKTWQFAYATYDPFDYDDVRIDVRAANLGVNDNNISLICRYGEGVGWYEFNIANSGIYNILYAKVRAEDGYISYTLIENGGSNKIKQGAATNDYTVICQGDTLTLYINEVLTKEAKDLKLTSGKVGVSVSSFPHLPVQINFDWIKISQP
jgi:hypothetical protein